MIVKKLEKCQKKQLSLEGLHKCMGHNFAFSPENIKKNMQKPNFFDGPFKRARLRRRTAKIDSRRELSKELDNVKNQHSISKEYQHEYTREYAKLIGKKKKGDKYLRDKYFDDNIKNLESKYSKEKEKIIDMGKYELERPVQLSRPLPAPPTVRPTVTPSEKIIYMNPKDLFFGSRPSTQIPRHEPSTYDTLMPRSIDRTV